MKLLMTIIATSALMSIFMNLKNTITDIQCRWTLLNFSHQKNVSQRTHRYIFSKDSHLSLCANSRGQSTLFFLLLCLLGFTAAWLGFSQILGYREKILQREKIMACTAWLEKKSLHTNSQIDKINTSIKKLRTLELASKISPIVSKAFQAQILLLQSSQQLLAYKFFSGRKKLFNNCLVTNANSLFLYHHHNLFLKRDPIWKTAIQKLVGTSYIKLAQYQMILTIKKDSSLFQAKRYLREG